MAKRLERHTCSGGTREFAMAQTWPLPVLDFQIPLFNFQREALGSLLEEP